MIEILFEDQFLIIVNKPCLVLSQPSFNKDRIAIKDQFEAENKRLKGKLFLHHRLDFETSGVFLMSQNKSVNKKLTEMFTAHQFQKKYICLTRPNELQIGKKVESQIIDSDRWIIRNHMAPAKGMSGQKKRMVSVKSGGWKAETEFQILKRSQKFFTVEAKPKTGRTHQIRQHLQESHRSILGDNIYGGKSDSVPRLMLHAAELKFEHPVSNQLINIVAKPPADFQKYLDL